MDLNALPEEDEEAYYDRHVQEYAAPIDRPESALDIANRVIVNAFLFGRNLSILLFL